MKDSTSDIRYVESLSDAFNDGDLEKLKKFIAENCTSDCKMMSCERKESTGESTVLSLNAIVEGIELVSSAWEHMLLSWPDGYFCIKDTKVTTLNDGKIAIVSNYSFAGTNIYRPGVVTDQGGKICDFQSGPLMVKDDAELEISPRRQAKGTIVMPLNDEKKIEAFQFYFSYIDNPPDQTSTKTSS